MIKIKVCPTCTATCEKTSLDFFSHVEATEYFGLNKNIIHSSCVSLGIAIYAQKEFYDDNNKHIPGALNEQCLNRIASFFIEYFDKMYHVKVIEIAIGHEHSQINNYCFLMIVMTFRSNFNKTLYPMIVTLKDEDLSEIKDFPFLVLKLKAKNQNIIKSYLKKRNLYRYPINGIQQTLNTSLLSNISISPIKYENILDNSIWILNEDFLYKFPIIKKWLIHYATPNNLRCRKALLIYSKIDYPFYNNFIKDIKECAMFSETFNQIQFNCNNPKAVILKDMETYTLSYEDTWKGLLNGNKAMIHHDNGTSFEWKFNIPCIVITQNRFLLSSLYHNEEFRKSIMFQEISKEDVNDKCEADFSNKLIKDLIEFEEDDYQDINESLFYPHKEECQLLKQKRKQSNSEEETDDK